MRTKINSNTNVSKPKQLTIESDPNNTQDSDRSIRVFFNDFPDLFGRVLKMTSRAFKTVFSANAIFSSVRGYADCNINLLTSSHETTL